MPEKAKISPERKKKLRALAALMNKQSEASYPLITPLIRCFDAVITPEENEFLLKMGTDPQTYQQLLSLSGMHEEEFQPFFETQLQKGLIWPLPSDTPEAEEYYELAPIMVGWFEIILSDGKQSNDKQEC